MLIQECLIRNKDKTKVAIKCGKETITYKKLYYTSISLSKKLNGQNNIVALYMENSIEYVVSYFAILFANRVVLPINIACKQTEVSNILEQCKIKTVITRKKMKSYFEAINAEIEVIAVDEVIENVEVSEQYIQPQEDNTALIIPTSGTISETKLVCLTHTNIMSNVSSICEVYKPSELERELIVLPLQSAFCNTTQLLTCLYSGMTIFIDNMTFNPEAIFQIIKDNQITYCEMVPSMLKLMALYYKCEKHDISSLKRICYGGEVINKVTIELVKKAFPTVSILQGYGMTEASPVISLQGYDDMQGKEDSLGKVLSCVTVQIADNQGKCLINEEGSLMVKGSSVMLGYLNQPQLDKNEWFDTGDIGLLDFDGYLYIRGRKKNIIIVGGQNVYPEEVEKILVEHENIKEALAFGVSDEILGEVVKAKVMLKSIDKFKEEEVINYCKNRLSSYKVPRQIIVCSELEKTTTNKIRRVKKQ